MERSLVLNSEKPSEMIEYLIQQVPEILSWFCHLLYGKFNRKQQFMYKLFTEIDFSNIWYGMCLFL